MKSLFDYNNPVMRAITKFGYLWLLDLLFVVTSLPVFTIGASLTALNYACMKLTDDEGSVVSNYFSSFKSNFRQATGIWMIYLVFGALWVFAMIFYNKMDTSSMKLLWAAVLAIGIIYLISLCWVFAIQSKFVNSIRDTIRFSFLVAFTNLPETVFILMILISMVVLNVTMPFIVNFLSLNFGFGLVFYLYAYFYKRVFAKYIDHKKPLRTDSIYK